MNRIIIGSDNVPVACSARNHFLTNADLLSIRSWRTYFSELLVEIQKSSFKNMHLKISSAKWLSFCLGLNELTLSHVSPDSFHFPGGGGGGGGGGGALGVCRSIAL